MKTIFVKWIAPAALLGVMLAPMAAQADPLGHNDHHPAPINARLHHQDTRILTGERHGMLTPREAERLHARDSRVARQEQRDRWQDHRRHDDRHLTPEQRRHLEWKMNHDSHAINHDEHHHWHG